MRLKRTMSVLFYWWEKMREDCGYGKRRVYF